MLRRVQLMLDDELDCALALQARLQRTSKSELVRRILRERLLPSVPPLEEDPLWTFVGAEEGAQDDSARIDEVVYGPLEPGR
jgi:hypothetical protein